MTTKSMKNGSNTTTATTNTGSKNTAESKFTGKPQNKEISSDDGQAYFNIENSPFAIVKYEEAYRIILGSDIINEKKFSSVEAARNFIKNEKWELMWAMCIWVMLHAEEIKSRTTFNQKQAK